jgi:Arc/MetJ-type ribon-helix-helix transcriptional regulator
MGKTVNFSIKLPEELREEMRKTDVDWADYIRRCIAAMLEKERRKKASAELDGLRSKVKPVPTDKLVSWLREERARG